MPFYNQDVYINVVGGLNIDGPAADLGLALAILSSIKNSSIKLEKTVIIGEVGLTGEIRPVGAAERISKEAEKLGFSNVIIPFRNKEKINMQSINIIGVNNLREAINKVF